MRDADSSDGISSDAEEQFRSLLEGLRTTLPGVQLITAFLLTMPLQPAFGDLAHHERVAYYVAFGSALAASLLLMAPPAHQRLRARPDGTVARHTPQHISVAVRLTNVGSTLFAISLSAVAYLVSSIVLGTAAAVAVTAIVALVCGWSWYWLPLVSFRQSRR